MYKNVMDFCRELITALRVGKTCFDLRALSKVPNSGERAVKGEL